jgi:4-hydroxythreonine-4-phosphate dehydrogenase
MIAEPGLPLALTLGEPAGIGPDLTLQIWLRRQALDLPPFYVIGDREFLAGRAHLLDVDLPFKTVEPAQAVATFHHALPVVPLDRPVKVEPGKPDATNAAAVINSIRRAVEDVLASRAAAIVTNPIAKNVLYRAGFTNPGHTEFLARLLQEKTGQTFMPVMMLWSPELAVVPVTIHIPLKDVVSRLSTKLIV